MLGKGQKVRTIYLTDQTTRVLAAWPEVRGKVALAEVHALLVVGLNGPGTAIGESGIRYLDDKHLRELGLKAEGMWCHALRQSAATWERAGDARLDAVAGMLCHASATTTGVYAEIINRITENPARYLEGLMGLS